MTSSNHYDFILRDLEREIAHHERTLSKKQQPPQKPPAPLPTSSLRYPANPSPGSGPVASLSVTSPCSMQPPEVASPSWPSPWLPALVELARQTNCAILLTRSLRQSPADPLHAPGPTSPLLQAARSRLLLAPDPTDDGRQLLVTTRHPLCMQPGMLAYDILASEAGIPTIHWLGERDRFQLIRLCTGPIRSPYRQAIQRFLHNSDTPQTIEDVLEATSYDREAGRKMLVRMNRAGELVSPARGLYTTAHHLCLVHFTDQTSPVPNVPSVSNVPSPQNPPLANSSERDIVAVPAIPVTDHTTSTLPPVPNVPNVSNPAHSTSEVTQQPIDTSPASLESAPKNNGIS